MRNLNYIYNGKRYVFSGTQYENPDKGTMRMQYTTQRTFTTTENATTTIQTATGTVTYPDMSITRYVYSTSSLLTTQKVTNMSSGTVRYGLTTDPEAAKYSPMPFVKENKTLYLGRSWTTYEKATDPKEVDKIKTMVTTTYTTSKDFKHTSSSEYETDGKQTIPYDATVGSYYSQMQYITEYVTTNGMTTGGLFSTRNLTYTAYDAYVSFGHTSSLKSISKYLSVSGTITCSFHASSEYVTTGNCNVFPGWYFATSESNLNTVTLRYVAQTSISYKTNIGDWTDPSATQTQSSISTYPYPEPEYLTYNLMTRFRNYGTVYNGTFTTMRNSASFNAVNNTRRISSFTKAEPALATMILNACSTTSKLQNDQVDVLTNIVAAQHDKNTLTMKRTSFTKNVDEKTFKRTYFSISKSTYSFTKATNYERIGTVAQTKTTTILDNYDINPKYNVFVDDFRRIYSPYYTVSDIEVNNTYSYSSIKTVQDVQVTRLYNPVIDVLGNEVETFYPNKTTPEQEETITRVNPNYGEYEDRFTAWGSSARFIEKSTSYNYVTKTSWETGGDKKTFTSILSGDPSEWITDEKTTSSPTVNTQRTMTKTSKFSGSDDWKYETTLASTVIKHVTRTKTYFPIITDAVTTMLSTQNYTTTEYPITATKTTHNFNV
jgi:hypothetical protein